MCKEVLQSLDWQKKFYQIIVSVTDLVLTRNSNNVYILLMLHTGYVD